jgi:hypothetical protein
MHHISYIKKNKKYDFTIEFKSTEHRIRKVAQYKKDAIGFKMIKLSDTAQSKPIPCSPKSFRFVPCSNKAQTLYFSIGTQRISHYNEHKTYIKPQS